MTPSTLLKLIQSDLAATAAKTPIGRVPGRDRMAWNDARCGVVRIDFDGWLGRSPDPAERRKLQRMLHRLAAAGRIQMLLGPGDTRSTHVKVLS